MRISPLHFYVCRKYLPTDTYRFKLIRAFVKIIFEKKRRKIGNTLNDMDGFDLNMDVGGVLCDN